MKNIGKKLSKKISKARVRRTLAVSGAHIVRDIGRHKLRWSIISIMHGWLLATIYVQPYTNFMSYVAGAAEIVLCMLTLHFLLTPVFRPGRVVHDWAVEESKHQSMKALTGKTSEELEQLLQYHMEQGNIDEADRLSQKLLAVVDGTFVESESEISKPTAIKLNNGALPAWMGDEEQAEPQQSNLPDWMKK